MVTKTSLELNQQIILHLRPGLEPGFFINSFMLWLKQVIAALLEFFSGEMKRDKKASDVDKTPKELKNKWRERIIEMERKIKKKNETTSQNLSGSDA